MMIPGIRNRTGAIVLSLLIFSIVGFFLSLRQLYIVPTNNDMRIKIETKAVERKRRGDLAEAMEDVLRILFSSQHEERYAADRYLNAIGGGFASFRFYVYDNLQPEYTWQHVSQCIDKQFNQDHHSNCDWGSSVCDEVPVMNKVYSTRRLFRNGDVVLSSLFLKYQGKYRTFDPNEAHLFVVPYPSTGHCTCKVKKAGARDGCTMGMPNLERDLQSQLAYFNETTAYRHLFFSSGRNAVVHQVMKNMPLLAFIGPIMDNCFGDQYNKTTGKRLLPQSLLHRYPPCGHMVMPYVTTNAAYQPSAMALLKESWWTDRQRTYSVTAVLSETTFKLNNMWPDFVEEASRVFGTTIGSLPINVSQMGVLGVNGLVNMQDQQHVMELYRNSTFCPCLAGDAPPQKRIMNVIMSGCIPVVLRYDATSEDATFPSYYKAKSPSTRMTYPFARGSFYGEPNMGIDYESLVVEVNGTCGLPCMKETLEAVFQDQGRLTRLRQNLKNFASLFSHGMDHGRNLGSDAFQHPDALAAILVQSLHYIHAYDRWKDRIST